jgi:hypothetical protein
LRLTSLGRRRTLTVVFPGTLPRTFVVSGNLLVIIEEHQRIPVVS